MEHSQPKEKALVAAVNCGIGRVYFTESKTAPMILAKCPMPKRPAECWVIRDCEGYYLCDEDDPEALLVFTDRGFACGFLFLNEFSPDNFDYECFIWDNLVKQFRRKCKSVIVDVEIDPNPVVFALV